MKKLISLLIIIYAFTSLNAQEIAISGNKFTVNGSEIWFNGINTPWDLFDDFGRSDFSPSWWSDEFARYRANNINLARVWIHGSGEVSPDIDETGYVSGASDLFWEHMDYLMQVASENQVYVLPALLSFDITKNTYSTYQSWRNWLQSEANVQSYIDNVLIPMVQRYNDEPYLLGWEICNEPEWMFENPEHGPQSFDDVQRMHAMFAAAIHENCTKPVTTGSAAPKWNSPIYDSWGDYEGNMFSDEALSAAINNPDAYLDFYQYHWYPWQTEWMESPYTMTTAEYDVDDRPVIVGESEGNDVCDDYICQTLVQMYESAYNNGFDGVCAWKTPQNDGHGTFENIAVATNAFYNNHPLLVYPDGSDPIPVTGISLSDNSVTIQIRDSYTITANVSPSDASDRRVTWTSSDESIVSVASGVITGEGIGTATITATTNDGGYTASCSVEVTDRQAICSNPATITLPFTQNGEGSYCFVVSGTIDNINSWGMDYLEINGYDYANVWSNSMPARIDGNYYIYYEASQGWSHMEIAGSGGTVTEYNLTVNTVGGGSVSPSGGSYTEGTNVTLTATPDAGYEFSGWSGDVSGTSTTTTITMDGDKTVTATFTEIPNPQDYTLSVNIVGTGTVNPSGGTYTEGTVVNLTASPASGYSFSGWSGDASGTSLTTSVTMDANKTVTATFTADVPDEYVLSVSVVGNGSVDPSGGTYVSGTQVTLTATPDPDNNFVSWSGDASGTSSSVNITMDGDKSVTATFEESGGGSGCDNPVTIALPYSQNGTGEYCWFTTDGIDYVNSWNMAVVEINGVDYTNTWSNSMPATIDGGYYIYYQGNFGWSHFEAAALKSAESMSLTSTVKAYPNPFNESINIEISNPETVQNIVVMDQLGKVVLEYNTSEISDFISIGQELSTGVYLLTVNRLENSEVYIINKN